MADRESIYSDLVFSCILLKGRDIVLSNDEIEICLHFETEDKAKKDYSRLMEAKSSKDVRETYADKDCDKEKTSSE